MVSDIADKRLKYVEKLGLDYIFNSNEVDVAKEVKNGVISIEMAREHYGVIIDQETFAVNPEETKKLRKNKKGD